VELDDESIRSIILTIVPAIDVLSFFLLDEFFVLAAFVSDSALAIALRTLFDIGGVLSAAFSRALRTLCVWEGDVGDAKQTISITGVYPSVSRNNWGGGIVNAVTVILKLLLFPPAFTLGYHPHIIVLNYFCCGDSARSKLRTNEPICSRL
jgi:hypothetical protein